MAPAATASRHSGHVADVLPRDPTIIKPHYFCPVSINLKRESERLKTFKNWPVRFLDPKTLAKNGFYYTQNDDIVKCIFCKIQIGYWEEGDDPAEDHERERKECPFVKNEPCGNIPLSDEEGEEDNSSSEAVVDVSQDVCGLRGLELRPFSEPERPNRASIVIDSSNLWKDFEELGVSKIYGPVSPNYATYASRIKTFDKWKSHNIQMPEKLAEAGFYYIGVDDNVLCFHCGGGLKNWEKNDDPWVEHARWFCKCRFVFHHKGREFIVEVASRKNTPSFTSEQPKGTLIKSKKYPEDQSSKSSAKETKVSDSKNVESSSSTSNSSTSTSSTSSKESPAEAKSPADDAELKMCRICFTRERGIVFLPCGHFVCCPQCTPSLSKCAVCREPFKATVRAYLS